MSVKGDYYEILGVSKTASLDEIKKAYREMALKFHPDRVPAEQKKSAEDKFKGISEAYAVLSDSQKKSLYDHYGHQGVDQKYSEEDIMRGGKWTDFQDIGINLEDILRHFSGFSRGFGVNFGDGEGNDYFGSEKSNKKSRRHGRDLQIGLEVSLEEAAVGVKKILTVPRYEICTTCSGSGAKPGSKRLLCSQCKGAGQTVVSNGIFQWAQPCSRCGGEGSNIAAVCPDCGGDGKVKVTKKIEVKIPVGVDNGSELRLRGEGEAGINSRGDLHVIIKVREHAIFQRHNNDIATAVTISLAKAVLGGEVEVPALEGKLTMKVPAGTQCGKTFRLKGKGLPDLHSREIGDELVRVDIEIPSRLTSAQRQLIEEFARLNGEDLGSKESFTDKFNRDHFAKQKDHMPTYEYECLSCKHKFEILQSITAKPKTKCPKCGKKLKELISATGGFIFKGSGFYATDYKKKSKSQDSASPVSCPKAKEGCAGCAAHQGK